MTPLLSARSNMGTPITRNSLSTRLSNCSGSLREVGLGPPVGLSIRCWFRRARNYVFDVKLLKERLDVATLSVTVLACRREDVEDSWRFCNRYDMPYFIMPSERWNGDAFHLVGAQWNRERCVSCGTRDLRKNTDDH